MTNPQGLQVDDADPAAGVDSEAPDGRTQRARGRRSGLWTWLVLVAGVVAVLVAFLVWHDADTDPERGQAALRDQALIEGTEGVEVMNSMDHRHVAAGLKAWESVSTGVLHDQLLTIGDDERQLLADQGKIATGHVVQAALTDLTDHTATMIAAMEVTVTDDNASAKPTVKRNRFSADLVLVDGHWKIENLTQVAVNVS